jgi:hypothetical protein
MQSTKGKDAIETPVKLLSSRKVRSSFTNQASQAKLELPVTYTYLRLDINICDFQMTSRVMLPPTIFSVRVQWKIPTIPTDTKCGLVGDCSHDEDRFHGVQQGQGHLECDFLAEWK